MFSIYIKRASESFGIVQTRSIHEKAIEVLPEGPARYVYCNTTTVTTVKSRPGVNYKMSITITFQITVLKIFFNNYNYNYIFLNYITKIHDFKL